MSSLILFVRLFGYMFNLVVVVYVSLVVCFVCVC